MSNKEVHIRLMPLGQDLTVPDGTPLQDVLFEHGVEFPCGGNGLCRGCAVRVTEGSLPVNQHMKNKLREEEIASGWRLACQCTADDDLTIELRQWDAAILSDESAHSFVPRDGYGVAVDIGTTTVVAQLLDLTTGKVLAVRTALNQQARHGADVMSRVEFAVAENGHQTLMEMIRSQIGSLLKQLSDKAGIETRQITDVILVGNTVMHHLFCNVGLEPLSHYPFETTDDGLKTFVGSDLGWDSDCSVQFLPCLGGFVGSDILAGIVATGLHTSDTLKGLIDLGTNGEIVFGDASGLLCASTAAGPAFEGALISKGMRAATGAIWKVVHDGNGTLACKVLGDVEATGICGSGLVDAVAAGISAKLVKPTGRLASGDEMPLAADVSVSQTDIRQLQLAKGAIAAGVKIVLANLEKQIADVDRVHLAGAFGNYVDRHSARAIGLLPISEEQIQASGNTALLGAKMALFDEGLSECQKIREMTRHMSLSADPAFQDTYVEEMTFTAA